MNLSAFRSLYQNPGPYASVYMDVSHDEPEANQEIRLRWRGLREELASAGDQATVAALDTAIAEMRPAVGDAGLAAFAPRGEVSLQSLLPEPPPRDSATWSPYPRIGRLVRAHSREATWMQVVVDRTGAIVATPQHGRLAVRGSKNFPITKVRAGGWSQSRYQRAAETTWEHNAKDVAAAVAGLADRVGADVIVVAGDDHERELLVARLPKVLRNRVVPAETRAYEPGTEPKPLDEATEQAVSDVVAARLSTVIDAYRAGLANSRAVTGLAAVTAAARQGQIETLLIADADADSEVWIDPAQPSLVAPDQPTLSNFGVTEPVREAADAALLAAATVTDAEVYVIDADDDHLVDGVGAILRYST